MYIDRIWPFTTFISRNKHNKNIRLRLYWLRLRVAEAEVQTSHLFTHSLPRLHNRRCPLLSRQTSLDKTVGNISVIWEKAFPLSSEAQLFKPRRRNT